MRYAESYNSQELKIRTSYIARSAMFVAGFDVTAIHGTAADWSLGTNVK